jgi:hypothetical protein
VNSPTLTPDQVAGEEWLSSLPADWRQEFGTVFHQAAQEHSRPEALLLLARLKVKVLLGLGHPDLVRTLAILRELGARACAASVLAEHAAVRARGCRR